MLFKGALGFFSYEKITLLISHSELHEHWSEQRAGNEGVKKKNVKSIYTFLKQWTELI